MTSPPIPTAKFSKCVAHAFEFMPKPSPEEGDTGLGRSRPKP